jgi:hypothetical protein
MSATIIGNNEWNQRGLVLTRMDAQEQVNGLVNVQVEYVGPSTRHDIISRSFYQDAPPPIWPSVVNKAELVTNRLYMESRTVTRANGLTTVSASYVGGLQRAGFNGYFLREQNQPNQTILFYQQAGPEYTQAVGVQFAAGQFQFAAGQPAFRLGQVTVATFTERVKLVEFVRVGATQSAKLPRFIWRDLVELHPFYSRSIVTSNPVVNVKNFWYIDTMPLQARESFSYMTPSVQVVTAEYRLS